MSVLALACVGGSEDIIDYLLKTNEIDLSCGRSVHLDNFLILDGLELLFFFFRWNCLSFWQLKQEMQSVWMLL